MYGLSSHRQLTSGGTPAREFGRGLTLLHREKSACYEMLHGTWTLWTVVNALMSLRFHKCQRMFIPVSRLFSKASLVVSVTSKVFLKLNKNFYLVKELSPMERVRLCADLCKR